MQTLINFYLMDLFFILPHFHHVFHSMGCKGSWETSGACCCWQEQLTPGRPTWWRRLSKFFQLSALLEKKTCKLKVFYLIVSTIIHIPDEGKQVVFSFLLSVSWFGNKVTLLENLSRLQKRHVASVVFVLVPFILIGFVLHSSTCAYLAWTHTASTYVSVKKHTKWCILVSLFKKKMGSSVFHRHNLDDSL